MSIDRAKGYNVRIETCARAVLVHVDRMQGSESLFDHHGFHNEVVDEIVRALRPSVDKERRRVIVERLRETGAVPVQDKETESLGQDDEESVYARQEEKIRQRPHGEH